MIRDAKSPTLVREMLLAYLPEKHRHDEVDDAAAGLTAGIAPDASRGMAKKKRRRHAAAVTAGS